MPRTVLLAVAILIDALVATSLSIAFQPLLLAALLPLAIGMMLALSDLDRGRARVPA